jgi:hypothetical protein
VFVLPAFLLATARRKREPAPESDAAGPPDVRHAAAAPG